MSQVRKKAIYPHDKVFILAIVLVVLGLVCIVVAIIGLSLRVWGHYVGTGLWGGTVTFAAGISGVISSQFKGSKSVKCYFSCSCLAILTCLIMIVLSSAGLDLNSNFYKHADYFKINNKKSTFYVHVSLLTLAVLSLMGNITSLFLCARHNGFYKQKNKKNHRSVQRASINSRSGLHEREIIMCNNSPSSRAQDSIEMQKTGTDKRIRKPKINRRFSYDVSKSQVAKDVKDSRGICQDSTASKHGTSSRHQGYRSLPHRSQHRNTKKPSYCKTEVNKDLLPTDYYEDELPSYSDAIKEHQPQPNILQQKEWRPKLEETITETQGHARNPKNIQTVEIRESQRGRRGNQEQLQLMYELQQNQQNEEAEQSQSSTSDHNVPSRLSFTRYITTHPKNVISDTTTSVNHNLNIPSKKETTELKTQYTIDKQSSNLNNVEDCVRDRFYDEPCGASNSFRLPTFCSNDNRPAFCAVNAGDIHVTTSPPLIVASPGSAFRPVKRRSSQKSFGEGDTLAISAESQFQLNTNSETNTNNMWKSLVLPSTLHGSNSNSSVDHLGAHPVGEGHSTGASNCEISHEANILSTHVSHELFPCGSSRLQHSASEMDDRPAVNLSRPIVGSSVLNTLPDMPSTSRVDRNTYHNSQLFFQAVPVIQPQAIVVPVPPVPQEFDEQNDQYSDSDLPYYSQIL